MPKKEGFRILGAQQNAAISEDKAKNAEGMHSVVRRKLADISNQPQNRKLIIKEKSQSTETAAKEYINQLQKENMAMVQMLAQRNKIIEHNGIELDRVRVNLLKMQEQNKQLANLNTQMLVELNSGKDRLKLLQHELGCATALLKARKLNLEGRATTLPSADADAKKLIKSPEEIESTKEDTDGEKSHDTTRNSQQNGVNPSVSEQVEYKEKTENKRLLQRRQSARFKVAEVEHSEDSFDSNKTIVSAPQMPEDSVGEQGSTSVGAAEVKNKGSTDSSGQQFGKSSQLRPSRAAAKKKLIQSQEEIESTKEDIDAEKPHETTRNSQQNGVNPSESEQVEYQEKTENKRLLRRRQSARSKVAEVEQAEDSFDSNKTIVSASQMPEDSVGEQVSTSVGATEVKNKGSTDSSGQQFGKSSQLRPSRAAAKKKLIKSQEEIESTKEDTDGEKPHETTRNSPQNGANPSDSEQVEYQEKTENKRLLRRRQSARFKVAEVEHSEDSFDTNKTIVCAPQMPEDSVGEQDSTSVGATEVKNKGSTDSSGQQFGISSQLRPSRAAAKKVQSYKEMPLKIKLRRSE